MQNNPPSKRGLYFEEFEIGKKFITAGRTVTEADIVSFAGLSGDYNAIHTDAEFAKTTPCEKRVAHGLLILSIVSGLANQTGFIEGTVLAFREIKKWKFSRPVYIGDTVHAEIEVRETKAFARLGGGTVELEFKVKTQDGEVCMNGTWNALIQSRP